MTRMNIFFSIGLCFLLLMPFRSSAQTAEHVRSTDFDAETIAKGYTLESSDHLMRLGIRPNTLNVSTRVDMKTLDPSIMTETLPSDKTLVGTIYLFDILNKTSYDGKDFFFLEIKYPQEDAAGMALHGRRRIYYYNKVKTQWEELPSEDHPTTQSVRSRIHLPYARLAIFEESTLEVGKASWYGYKNCDCVASPDYPKGSMLEVSSVADPTKIVKVKVNDYGPDRTVFPDRIIDLDKNAFQKLAPLGAGVISVRIRFLE